MQEAGVPVTFAYISDAHDGHGVAGKIHHAYGPGEKGYVQQLEDYDKAFGEFFTRLKNDGITKDNTLFVVTVEEERPLRRHRSRTTPAATASTRRAPTPTHVSEVNGDLKRLVATYNASHGTAATTNFSVHSDMAPNVYITGNPARDSATARTLEQAMSDMEVTNPLLGRAARTCSSPWRIRSRRSSSTWSPPTRRERRRSRRSRRVTTSSTRRRRRPCANNDLNCVFLPNDGQRPEPDVRVEPRRHPAGDPHRRGSAGSGPGIENLKEDTARRRPRRTTTRASSRSRITRTSARRCWRCSG